tara:strand:+ start:3557 stop:4741 length:1185 start_codon:yes stop_codon:yes gene_type:complete
MASKSIQDLYTDFDSIVSGISGLNQFFMIDKSEINSKRNCSYPILVVEPPNSSSSNINKGFDDYKMVCYVLAPSSKANSDYEELALYDEAMDLFNDVLNALAAQRNGYYIIIRDSFDFDRVTKVGSDQVSGLKITFNLLAPSKLSFGSPPAPLWLTNTSNLLGFYVSSENLSITADTLDWTPVQSPTQTLQINQADRNSITGFDGVNLTFTGNNTYGNTEALTIPSITLPSGAFSVLAKVYVNGGVDVTDKVTLFSFNDSAGNYEFKVEIITSGGSQGEVEVTTQDSGGIGTARSSVIPLSPFGFANGLQTIAIVNDPTSVKTYLYTSDGLVEFPVAYRDAITTSKFMFGGSLVSTALPEPYRGFYGSLRSLAMYSEVLTESECRSIMSEMESL